MEDINMQTKKDFEQVANSIIKSCKKKDYKPASIRYVINFFVTSFKKSNPRFDEVRFREFIEKGIYGTVI
tara:strand:- start:129 stop:338 length:210 start_codon:yes stop_codon:yes gene_type:complete